MTGNCSWSPPLQRILFGISKGKRKFSHSVTGKERMDAGSRILWTPRCFYGLILRRSAHTHGMRWEEARPIHLPLQLLWTRQAELAPIRGIALSRDKRSLIYETLPISSAGGSKVFILSTSSLSHSWEIDLSGRVKRLIGTFQNSIVFLDHDYWICTWEIEARPSDVKRHFFLPKDWLNSSTLQMATLNEQGTFFCPKFGNVIIVRNGMKLWIRRLSKKGVARNW